MKTPLERIRQGAFVLVVVFVTAVVGFRFLGDFDWTSALWMVVITVSTVGYSEQSTFPPSLQLFTIVVILLGLSASAYTFGGLIQMLLEGEVDRLLGVRRMSREMERLSDHTIVCGYGRMGQRLAAHDMQNEGIAFVVLEQDAEVVQEAQSHGLLCLLGNATEEEVLLAAGIERASALVAALPSDAESVFITLTARNLNPNIHIIARAEQVSTESKLRQAGANRVVLPTVVGARQMVRMITRPATADLMDMVASSEFADLELDEFMVLGGSKLIGMTVHETGAHHRHRLLFVAIKQPDGKLVFNPDAKRTFAAGEILMVTGHREDIQHFGEEFAVARK